MEETNQEQLIIQAAEELFLAKGFHATSTTEIAKKAGCNQALVHYYFRTKEKLFYRIFTEKFKVFYRILNQEVNRDMDFISTLRHIVGSHFDILRDNPMIPHFIINELFVNEERRKTIIELMKTEKEHSDLLTYFETILNDEIAKGRVRPTTFLDLILNIGSLNVMTFVSLPVLVDAYKMNEDAKNNYLNRRKDEICETIYHSLLL